MPNNIFSVHDRFFKVTMSKIDAAKEFLQQFLPAHVKNLVKLDTLQLQPDSFIDENLKGHLVDILYSVNFEDKPGYIYVLFEHLSSSNEMIAFRLAKYMINIMNYHIEKTKSKKLPLICPIVFYTGNTKYNAPKSIFELFEPKERKLAEEFFLQPYKLVDVKDIPDENLQKQVWFGVMGQIFKHRFKEVVDFTNIVLPHLIAIDKQGDVEYIYSVIEYVARTKDIDDKKQFFEVLTNSLSKPAREAIMTIAEQLKQEGMQQGIQKGRHEGSLSFVKYLLSEGKSLEEISRITGLSFKEVENIKQEIK